MDINNYKVDLLAIGAHPDDVELGAGGTIAKLTSEGFKVAIIDLTKGESGTRGTPEQRIEESLKAKEILGVSFRENLEMPDTKLAINDENVLKLINIIRKYRPNSIVIPAVFERHPDHENASRLVRDAMFKSGLLKYKTYFENESQERYRIRKMYSYLQSYEFPHKASFYVDISSSFETKMNAIKAYSSQVFIPGESDPEGPVTRLFRPEFLEEIEARAIYFGTLTGVRYAEAFLSLEPISISSLSKLF